MFNPRGFDNSRPDGFGVLEAVEEGGPGRPRRFVPLRRTELRGELAGPLACFHLTQVFGYSTSECGLTLEAAYRFPLPGDAAVIAVRVRFGDVSIRARLADRLEAEAGYEAARREGRRAALATRESPDVFTLQVAGLRPDCEVTVETTFVQLARAEGAGWSVRVPLTTAPRYVREDEAGSRGAAARPLSTLRDPGHRFALDLGLRGPVVVESPTHALDVSRDGPRRRARLLDGEVVPDRDLVLSWRDEAEADRPALAVARHDDPASGFSYFLARVAPPAVRDPGRGPAREVILLVDHSGSMAGPKWQAADWAVERFLADLTPRDRFALGLFHDTTRWFAEGPRPAEPGAVGEAIAFLRANRDQGGTELGVALEQALGQDRGPGDPSRHVLIVTDAEVTDVSRLLGLAERESARPDRRRVSLLCIDAAPNSFLALELAERGGGVARFLTSDPDQQDIATALDEVLADWAEPVLAGLRLEVDRPGARGSGRATVEVGRAGWSGIDLGDLPAGRSPWVVGRIPLGDDGPWNFRLATAGGHELASLRSEAVGEAPEGPALKALFGARQVFGLERLAQARAAEGLRDGLRRLGHDPASILDDPSEVGPGADVAGRLRALLVREALEHGLACSETAFLAERAEAGRVVEGRVEVANALPAGWSAGFAGGPGVPTMMPRGGRMRASSGIAPGGAGHGLAPAAPCAAPAPRFGLRFNLEWAGAGAGVGAGPGGPPAIGPGRAVVFRGATATTDGEALLFDTARGPDSALVPDPVLLNRLAIRFLDGEPGPGTIPDGLAVLIFVADPTLARARVRLVDLIRQGGERPLNLRRGPGEVLRVALVDPGRAWERGSPRFELTLGW